VDFGNLERSINFLQCSDPIAFPLTDQRLRNGELGNSEG
jgi:hypothetical protein